jgi:molybdenum-dependent DNA-binding transcriptional regulator ModE
MLTTSTDLASLGKKLLENYNKGEDEHGQAAEQEKQTNTFNEQTQFKEG